MRLRPCIDIHDGKVKQIVGSSLSDSAETKDGREARNGLAEAATAQVGVGEKRTVEDDSTLVQNFVSERDGAYYANLYREKSLPGGHIILLNKVGTPEYEADKIQAFGALSAYPGGMMIGGGITPETAPAFLDAGASHVIVTSYVFRDGKLDWTRLAEMVHAIGADRLVLDLSCKKHLLDGEYVVVTDRWQKETTLPITFETLDELAPYCDEFLIHAADVEGKRGGVETDLLNLLGAWGARRNVGVMRSIDPPRSSEAGTAIGARPVHAGSDAKRRNIVYAGGVHTLSDIDVIRDAGHGLIDYTVGSALDLFGGNLSLEELIAHT